MKILLCNIPLRPKADPFPPVACTSLCNVLTKAGYNPQFYNIDVERPSLEKLSQYFTAEQFDIVGISVVASTGYRYTKDLANLIKKGSPKTQIILGGNLAVSYEIILRKCLVDVCVIGKGEKVLLNLVKHWRKYGHFKPSNQELYEIKGITFLDSDGASRFTGYEKPLGNDEIDQPDYELLDKFSNINHYIINPMTRHDLANDPRSYETHRQGKKLATIFTSRGCPNRCAFCHRWIKGYRIIPAQKV
ncbi:cobalamin-dependent protein, partial [bacterium]|nr:cobalamin-dependent protein [bacterium]